MLRISGKAGSKFSKLRRRFRGSRGCPCLAPCTLNITESPLSDWSTFRGGRVRFSFALPSKKWKFPALKFATQAEKDETTLEDGIIAEMKHGISKPLLSIPQCDAIEAPSKDPLAIRQNGRTTRSMPVLAAGAGATGVLLLVAVAAVSMRDDEGGVFRVLDATLMSSLSKAVSEWWDSAAEVGKGVSNVFHSLSDTLNKVTTKTFQAGVAAMVLVQCLNAVLFCKGEDAAHELGLRWRLRVAALLADLAGATDTRRRAMVEAGNGVVVDWLLEAVGRGELECRSIQAEAARAIAHLLSDTRTCEKVLGRPNAMSHLLLFTASIQPQCIKTSKHKKLQLFFEDDESSRGRSLLVAAIMDIITSSCESGDRSGPRPKLSKSADARDIAAALKVIEEGGLHLDGSKDDDEGHGEDNGGLRGIGIRVLGGSSVVGLQRDQHFIFPDGLTHTSFLDWGRSLATWWSAGHDPHTFSSTKASFIAGGGLANQGKVVMPKQSSSDYGLWDDLQGRYVAVPLAAWALATWAQASSANCFKIIELDKDGDAIMAAVMAPERTVKWHGAVAIQCLLENIGSDEAAATWSPALLGAAVQASNVEDAQLALVTLNAFHSCIRRSASARKTVLENSLPMMRDLAKQTQKNTGLQKVLAQALAVLSLNGGGLSSEEGKRWSSILLHWACNRTLENVTRSAASRVLAHLLEELGQAGIPLSQTWLAMLLIDAINGNKVDSAKKDVSSVKSKEAKAKGLVQNQANQIATQAATELAKVVLHAVTAGEVHVLAQGRITEDVSDSPLGGLLMLDSFQNLTKGLRKDFKTKLTAADAADATVKAIKALTELSAEDETCQLKIIEAGGIYLLRRLMLGDDYEKWSALEICEASKSLAAYEHDKVFNAKEKHVEAIDPSKLRVPPTAHVRKHAARLLSILALQPSASGLIKDDEAWCRWLEECANSQTNGFSDLKTLSYARATLLNVADVRKTPAQLGPEIPNRCSKVSNLACEKQLWPRYEDMVFLLNTESHFWKQLHNGEKLSTDSDVVFETSSDTASTGANLNAKVCEQQDQKQYNNEFEIDVVFVHGLCGGPFKTWRVADNKASTIGRTGLVEKIDVETGREGTCWPKEWLARDLPESRLLTVKYKTNFSQWSGATLPLQEVSSMLLDKLIAAGVGDRPVVFITHSMGGLVVKQMLMQAGQDKARSHIVNQTSGIVFYSCPHFGSKLADVPWRIGLVLRPAPSIVELRSGSTRLEELNRFIRNLHKGGLEVLSFSETKVTPLVEGYGGWALRMEVVPIESAYPGFGELVVLDGTDHVNSCKPLSRDDPAYTQTLQFLQKLVNSAKQSEQLIDPG